jgi:hypothetical protein
VAIQEPSSGTFAMVNPEVGQCPVARLYRRRAAVQRNLRINL